MARLRQAPRAAAEIGSSWQLRREHGRGRWIGRRRQRRHGHGRGRRCGRGRKRRGQRCDGWSRRYQRVSSATGGVSGAAGTGGNATAGASGTGTGGNATAGTSGTGTGGNATAGASGTGTGGNAAAGVSGSGVGGAGGGATTATGTGGAAGAGPSGTGGTAAAGASGTGAGGAAGQGETGGHAGNGTGGVTEGASNGGCGCDTVALVPHGRRPGVAARRARAAREAATGRLPDHLLDHFVHRSDALAAVARPAQASAPVMTFPTVTCVAMVAASRRPRRAWSGRTTPAVDRRDVAARRAAPDFESIASAP